MKHLVRFAPLVLALLLGAAPAARATEVTETKPPSLRELVDRLFSADADARRAAREAILARESLDTLPGVLDALEDRLRPVEVQRVYDVRDLADSVPGTAELVSLLKGLVSGDVRPVKGNVIVRGTPEEQAKVEDALAGLRARRGPVVTLATRIVSGALPIPALAEGEARLLSPEETEQVLAALAGGAAETVTAPRITVYSGERANVTILEKHSFVTDYELDHPAPGTIVADPVVTTVTDGLTLELRPRLEGDACVLTANLTSSRLKKPVEARQIDLGVGAPVTIQLPTVRSVSRRVVANVPLAGTVAIDLPILDDAGDERSGVLLVTAERVQLDEPR